ncbi:DUF881 domain-containing protein [Clostridium hydrogenum]|uniref:DUF881 domain-containing protein n=1 Tax=Clostridium hydrogenum TaxID=2855764 RepID=UPI001F271514|nr:DUF881 domain-containing protein [Clostridium hydrogenum]
MKNNEASVFIFIASIFVGILISSNMNFEKVDQKVYLNSEQYQDAYRNRSKLESDINDLKEQYFNLNQKINDLTKTTNDMSSTNQQMKDELDLDKMAVGNVDIEGQGIEITLNDGGGEFTGTVKNFNTVADMIHDHDIRYVVNDLRCAGAEAISINGQRILSNSEIYCNAEFILVNGIKTGAPFDIRAIGDMDKLQDYMLSERGYLNYLKLRGEGNITIDLETNPDIRIFSSDVRVKDYTIK